MSKTGQDYGIEGYRRELVTIFGTAQAYCKFLFDMLKSLPHRDDNSYYSCYITGKMGYQACLMLRSYMMIKYEVHNDISMSPGEGEDAESTLFSLTPTARAKLVELLTEESERAGVVFEPEPDLSYVQASEQFAWQKFLRDDL